MLTFIVHVIAGIVYIVFAMLFLFVGILGIYSGIKEMAVVEFAIGVVFLLIFWFAALSPLVYTKTCPECNSCYSNECKYCSEDGARLEE